MKRVVPALMLSAISIATSASAQSGRSGGLAADFIDRDYDTGCFK